MVLMSLVFAGCAADRTTLELERQRAVAFGMQPPAPSPTPTPRPRSNPRPDPSENPSPSENQGSGWGWTGGGSGAKRIIIDLSDQKAYFLRGGKEVGWTIISSGRAGMATPVGTYSVTEKDIDHRSSLYGSFVDSSGNVVRSDVNMRKHSPGPGQRYVGASMHYFLRFHGGYGMHAGYLPGYPASHGCVRLPRPAAEKFYYAADYGTPVIVRH